MQYVYGSGSLWGVSNVANPTPARFGVTQDISIDFSASTKALFGQKNLPVSVARGALSTKGKVNFGQFNGRVINDLFFGGSSANSQVLAIDNEPGTIPASVSYVVTVANSAAWQLDLGVIYSATGLPFTRVASSPAIGQYSVAAGVYTFAAADASVAVKVSYTYGAPTSGQLITIAQQDMGTQPKFKAVASMPFNGQKATFTFNSCIAGKLSFATKLEDYTKPAMEFEAFADDAGNLGTISLAEAA